MITYAYICQVMSLFIFSTFHFRVAAKLPSFQRFLSHDRSPLKLHQSRKTSSSGCGGTFFGGGKQNLIHKTDGDDGVPHVSLTF